MVNVNGTIILNGITDKELELVWGYKAKHPSSFAFAPSAMQVANGATVASYNNVQFSYSTLHGLNLIAEIVNVLSKKEEMPKAA